ncbi:uncharacterized protein METZ01_LOCUS482271, partial [marine metagenome]
STDPAELAASSCALMGEKEKISATKASLIVRFCFSIFTTSPPKLNLNHDTVTKISCNLQKFSHKITYFPLTKMPL